MCGEAPVPLAPLGLAGLGALTCAGSESIGKTLVDPTPTTPQLAKNAWIVVTNM